MWYQTGNVSMDLQIIIPRAPTAQEIRIKWRYEIWKQEKEAREPKFVIENIRFVHDPYWRERFFSIQAIGDVHAGKCVALGPIILWNIVKYTLAVGAAAPYLITLF